MELKTLKDLELKGLLFKREDLPGIFKSDFVHMKELKAEAIKWIKDLEKDGEKSWKFGNSSDYPYAETTLSFIKNFFNITEEDLK